MTGPGAADKFRGMTTKGLGGAWFFSTRRILANRSFLTKASDAGLKV